MEGKQMQENTVNEGDAEGRMVLPDATKDQLKALPEFRYIE